MIRMTLFVLAAFGVVIAAVALSRGRAATVVGDSVHGKVLFEGYCAECHTLRAAGSTGRFGPNLDNIGKVTPQRVRNAIRIGGTGQGRMPQNLLQGKNAQDVANFVASVAGR